MADTTPVSNNLQIRLANKIDDPVAAGADNGITASTDGEFFSASIRNQRLNQAYVAIIKKVIEKYEFEESKSLLQGAISTQAITFSSSGTSLNKDFLFPIDLIQSTNIFSLHDTRSELTSDFNPYVDYVYVIEAGKIYGYIRSSGTLTLQSSGSATFYYIQAPRINTTSGADIAVNTSTDVALDPRWHDAILDYAAYLLCMDKGSGEWLDKAKNFYDASMAKI